MSLRALAVSALAAAGLLLMVPAAQAAGPVQLTGAQLATRLLPVGLLTVALLAAGLLPVALLAIGLLPARLLLAVCLLLATSLLQTQMVSRSAEISDAVLALILGLVYAFLRRQHRQDTSALPQSAAEPVRS